MWATIFTGLKAIAAPATTVLKGWQERKKVKLENDVAIAKAQAQAKINYLAAGQAQDIAWENLSIQNSSWKDEWFVVLLSVPLVMCFIPGLDVYVKAGFESLLGTPEWYRWALMVAVGSSFGYRKIADFMSLKKGG